MLAELGSLSVEFTRLAQITKEPKYYDAVARITNELDIWQNNTKMPGLWPLMLDASGCKKPDISLTSQIDHSSLNGPGTGNNQYSNSSASIASEPDAATPISSPDTKISKDSPVETSRVANPEENNIKDAETPKMKPSIEDLSKSNVGISKRQLSDEDVTSGANGAEMDREEQPDCEPQGLTSLPGSINGEFTLGGMADSVYEYLPKQYMLLGGLEDVYRRMYEAAMETTKAHLLFRPMLPDNRNVLHSGMIKTNGDLANPLKTILHPEGTHLTCFAGGMFAIGAKIFNRDGDLEIAKKLTDGCVWAYEATVTGIMPEHYHTVPCKSQETCIWNETLYFEALDPHRETREKSRQIQQQQLSLSEEKHRAPEKALDETKENKKLEQPENVEATPITNGTTVAETTFAVDAASTAQASMPREKEESSPKLEKFKRQLVDFESEISSKPAGKVAGTPTSEDVPEAKAVPVNESDNNKKEPSKNDTVESQPESEPKPEPIAKWTDDLVNLAQTADTSEHIPTHEEFVEDKIRNARLPTGMTKVIGSSYSLRYVMIPTFHHLAFILTRS